MSALLDRPLGRVGEDAYRRVFSKTYTNDPDGWAQDRLGVESWSKAREIRESVRDHRYTAVHAGHECGKSHTVASLMCWWVETRLALAGVRPKDVLVVSTAPVHHQVQGVLWAEVDDMHSNAHLVGELRGLGGSSIPEWHIGTHRVAFGRAPDKPQNFQGYHAKHTLVIIDEAGEVPDWLFHRAESLAANDHCRIVAVGNPYDPGAHFAEVCAPDSGWNVVQMGAFDTPRWTGETVSADLISRLVGPDYVEKMRKAGEDSALYQTTVLGQFPDVSADQLFPPRILRKAFDITDLPGTDQGAFGVDVARYGEDETCVYRNRGGHIRLVEAWHMADTEETADRVAEILDDLSVDGKTIPVVVDAVGIGAGVYDKLHRRGYHAVDFNAGERALEPDRFVNRRAESFWTLREMMDDGLVQLDDKDDELRAQLGRIKWRQASGGRVQIESKDDMRKRSVKSPDRADAVAMALTAPSRMTFPDDLDETPPAPAAGADLDHLLGAAPRMSVGRADSRELDYALGGHR